jgi:hypothetical protein
MSTRRSLNNGRRSKVESTRTVWWGKRQEVGVSCPPHLPCRAAFLGRRYSPEQELPSSLIELTLRVGLCELLAPAEGSVDGEVDGLLIELPLSIVPLTSTLRLTYFDRSSLADALSFRPLRHALDDDAVPVVPVVLLAAVSLPPIDTLFNTNSPADDVVVLGLAVVPVVPVVDD